MPKQSPVPDEVTKPFWDACNEGKLIMQTCKACDRMQFPPEATCVQCGSGDNFEWREVNGKGKVHGFCTMYDSRIKLLQENQPFNIVVIELDDNPEIKMLSHLPGSAPEDVPVGASVQLEFEATAGTDQKVPEWRVIS